MDDQYYLNKLKELNTKFGNTYSLSYESNNIESDRNLIKNEYNADSRVLINRKARNLEHQINYDNLINEGISYDSIGSYMNDIYKLAQAQPQKPILIKINYTPSQYASYNIIISNYESSEEILENIQSIYNLDIETTSKHNYVNDKNTMIFINFILNYGKVSNFMLNTAGYTIDNIEYYNAYLKTFSNLIASLMQLLSFKIIYNKIHPMDPNYITNLNNIGNRLHDYLSVVNNQFIQELTDRLIVYIKYNFNVDLLINAVKEQLFKTLTEDEARILIRKNYPNAQ